MRSIENIKFVTCWQTHDVSLREKIADLWLNKNILDKVTVRDRLDQAVYAILEGERVIGVSTVFLRDLPLLNNSFYVYRCYIDNNYRAPALDVKLFVKTRDFLEKECNGSPVKGILAVVQNDDLKKWNHAIWPDTGMMYIGDSPKGDPMRVYYFRGAKI